MGSLLGVHTYPEYRTVHIYTLNIGATQVYCCNAIYASSLFQHNIQLYSDNPRYNVCRCYTLQIVIDTILIISLS